MALAVPLIWGFGIVFAKAALDFFPPILLMAFRFLVTALAMVWFVKPPKGKFRQIFWIALVSAAIQYGFTFSGLKYMDASTTVLIVQLEVPVLVLLAAVFLGERPGTRKIFGIAVAFAGVVVIAGDPEFKGGLYPVFLVLIGITTWALGQIMVRKLGVEGGFTLIAWVAVFAAPQLFIASAMIERDQLQLIRDAGWQLWATVLYLGLVMTALGYGFWYRLLALYPVSKVGPYLLLIPVASIAGSVILLGETLTLPLIVGGTIIVFGVAMVIIESPKRQARALPHPE